MDQQQQQQYPPQSSGYGYGYSGAGAPQQYPPSEASTGGGFGGRAMAPPMTNYNTQGNAGATTIPNFGGSHAMEGPPGASGAPNYYSGYPTALPPPHVGGFQVGGAPMPNSGGNESGRSSQSGNTTCSSSKGSRISKGRDDGEEDPSIFDLLMTGISRQIKSCVANSCGGAESGDEDEVDDDGGDVNDDGDDMMTTTAMTWVMRVMAMMAATTVAMAKAPAADTRAVSMESRPMPYTIPTRNRT